MEELRYTLQHSGAEIDAGIAKALNPDDAPTQNSPALVTSGGSYAAIVASQSAVEQGVNANIATEETSPAQSAHAVGDIILYGGKLYRVTASISAGGTIVTSGAGTNVVATTLASESGTKVEANPTLAGTESDLDAIEIDGTKFKIPSSDLQPYTSIPYKDGVGSAGSSTKYARGDHRHPTDSNIARVESDTTATKAYVAGEYVVVGGQLYLVTSAIAIGATFTAGTNVTAVSVGDRLQSIETSVNELGIYRFTKTVSYYSESNSLTLNVPKNSLHLIIVGTPGGTKYRYLGIVSGYTTTSYDEYDYPTTYNYVTVSEIFKGTDITVTGTSASQLQRTLTFAFTSDRTSNYTAVVEVLTLSGGRMT